MPSTLKNSLIELLPENMQGSVVSCIDSVDGSLMYTELPLDSDRNKLSESKPPEASINRCAVRLKNVKPVTVSSSVISVDNNIKRQKVHIRGPRVKHVCRSASIVLGQHLATFPVSTRKLLGDLEANSSQLQKKKGFQELIKNKYMFVSGDDDFENTPKFVFDLNQPNVPCVQEKKRQKSLFPSPVPAIIVSTLTTL